MLPDQMPAFLRGAVLFGAGMASFYGDRLWVGLMYRVAAGGVLMLVALLRHFEVIS